MEALDKIEEKDKVGDDQELSLEDLDTTYVSNPKVGEGSDWMTIEKIKKSWNTKITTKDGESINLALSGVDFRIDVVTDKGPYTIPSWELYNKIRESCKRNKAIVGTVFKVEHIADGFNDKEAVKDGRCYKVLTKNKEGKEEEVVLPKKEK